MYEFKSHWGHYKMKTLHHIKEEIKENLKRNKDLENSNKNSEYESKLKLLEEEALEVMQYISDYIKTNPTHKSFLVKHPRKNTHYVMGHYSLNSGYTIYKESEIASMIKSYCTACDLKTENMELDDDGLYLGVKL